MIQWPEDLAPERLARVQAAFAAAGGIRYQAEAPGLDYWQSAAETRQRGTGDCEDIERAFDEALLSGSETRDREALRLAIVDTGGRPLESYRAVIDDWGEVWVPGVNHACCLWLPDVAPTLAGAEYMTHWITSRKWLLDATHRKVHPWGWSRFTLAWSWGLEGPERRGVWRKHFPWKPVLAR